MARKGSDSPRGLFAWCMACEQYEVEPRELAVDVNGSSKDEADALCVPHRARLTEGSCVFCGRREPWVMLHESSDIGACRPCYVARFGEEAAREIELAWQTMNWARKL
jgi:hypothetical protein